MDVHLFPTGISIHVQRHVLKFPFTNIKDVEHINDVFMTEDSDGYYSGQ